MKKQKILILEDNKLDAKLIEEELLEHKFDFISKLVDTEKDFITAIHNFQPDIILSDYRLPQFTGFEALEIAKKLVPTIPFIIVTGTLSEEEAVESIKKGSWDYIIKENLVRLVPAIENALQLKEEKDKNKKAEERLKNSEERLKILFEFAPDAYFLSDLKGTFLDGNKTAEDLMGFKKEELIGKNFLKLKLLSANGLLKASKLLLKNLQGKGTGPDEFILNRKDGSQVPVEISTYPVKIKNKTVVLGIARDITDRKQADDVLQESEEKFRSIVNSSPDIIMQILSDGVITYINYEYATQKPKDIIGKTIYDFMPTEFHEKARSVIKEVFKTGNSFSFENLSIGTDENAVWYNNNIAAISKNGKIVAATIIATDISKLKQTEIMQNEFVASISHELRTPLTTIRESLSILSEGLFGQLNAEQLNIVNPSLEDIDRLARIINNLLTISTLETQKIKLNREMIDIVSLTQGVVSSFKFQIERKNIELVFTPNHESIYAYIDRDRIIQVFMNLIGNSMKFTEKGKIEVLITEKENEVECCIVDTGRGIEQKDLGTLFDRFHQVSKVMRAGEKGSGLGLSISKGILKLHHGRIWVDSKINKGSKFFFSLPHYSTDDIIVDNIENEIKIVTDKHIKASLLLIKLNDYSDIESRFSADKAKNVTASLLQIIQKELAPEAFSFIKKKNEVLLFSNITKQNFKILTSKLEDMLTRSVLKIDQDLKVNLSYGYSFYPDNGDNANELIKHANMELARSDKD